MVNHSRSVAATAGQDMLSLNPFRKARRTRPATAASLSARACRSAPVTVRTRPLNGIQPEAALHAASLGARFGHVPVDDRFVLSNASALDVRPQNLTEFADLGIQRTAAQRIGLLIGRSPHVLELRWNFRADKIEVVERLGED
jgi:hypothetical protein